MAAPKAKAYRLTIYLSIICTLRILRRAALSFRFFRSLGFSKCWCFLISDINPLFHKTW